MATAPIVDATDSQATEQDVVTLQFQRLQRVRARQRSRRRHRLILIAPLLVGLAGAGVVVFAAVLGTSLEWLLDARAPTPGDPPPPPAFSTIGTGLGAAVTPASALVPDAAPPQRPPADIRPASVARPSATRSTPRAAVPQAGAAAPPSPPPLEERQDDAAVAPTRDEPNRVEAADAAAAIDWLLNRSRTNGR
jgi:hypothetical protein